MAANSQFSYGLVIDNYLVGFYGSMQSAEERAQAMLMKKEQGTVAKIYREPDAALEKEVVL